MVNKFKININNIKKGGAQAAYNTSSPVDADLSTGSLKDPLKTEFNNFIKKNNNNHLITGVIEQDNLSKNANFIKKFYCKSLQLKS